MIDAGVEAQLSCTHRHFSGAAGDADDARASPLGELARHRADRAGRRRDDHRLALLRAGRSSRCRYAVSPASRARRDRRTAARRPRQLDAARPA